MKRMILLSFVLICFNLQSQTVHYDSDSLQIVNIQNNLNKYYEVRKEAFMLEACAVSLGIIGSVYYDSEMGPILVIASGILGISSWIAILSAEKHLKRASIRVSPGKLTVNF